MLKSLFWEIGHRIQGAFSTLPDFQAWAIALLFLLIYTLIALPVGFQSGFLRLEVERSRDTVIGVMLKTIVMPAIAEEFVFRVLLLPHPQENPAFLTLLLSGIVSLILFILYHPLNAFTFYPAALKTFLNPVFLSLASLLGILCTLSYEQSGSIWTAVLIHWVIVVVWLLVFGGYQRLHLSSLN